MGNLRIDVGKGETDEELLTFLSRPIVSLCADKYCPQLPRHVASQQTKNATHKVPQNSAESHTEVCSAPSPYLTLLEEVSEVSEAKSLFFCFFRLDRSGPWEPRWTVVARQGRKNDWMRDCVGNRREREIEEVIM